MKKLNLFAAVALFGAIGFGAMVVAQTILVPKVTNVSGSADLVQVVVGGSPSAGNQYATAGQVGAVEQFTYGGTISADPNFTFTNGLALYTAHASGTLSAATLTTEPNPTDGKRECYVLDQVTTTLTWTANTGQTIGANVKAAGALGVPVCIIYKASTATWYASN